MFAAPLLLCLTTVAPSCEPPSAPAAWSRVDEADERYKFIAGLCEQGHFEMAVEEATRFLEEHPRHAKASLARYRLASALFELDKPDAATPHYRVLSKLASFEYRAEALLRLGQCELLGERYERAREALSAAYDSDQDYLKPTAAFFLGETEFHLEAYASASQHYEVALRSKEAATYHAHARRGLAWSRFREGNYKASIQAARQFLRENAGHELVDEVSFLLGDACARAEDSQGAEEAWSSIRSGEYQAAALRGRAYLRSQAEDERGAARLFAELLDLDPRGPFAQEAAVQCGAHLLRNGAARDALKALEHPAAGEGPETLYWRGRAQAEAGDQEKALATLERAERNAQGDLAARIATARGDLLYELGRLEESAAAYGSDSSDYSLHAAATAQLNAGRAREALKLATEFCEEHPRSPYLASTRLVQAEAYFQLERFAEALGAYTALASASKDLEASELARATSRTGWCHYKLGELDDAARSFATVSKNFGESAEADQARYMEGRALQESGEDEGAARAWKRYLQEHPTGEHLSEVRLQLARLGLGDDHLEELLRAAPEDPLAAIALFELAESQAARGEQEAAIATYRSYLERFPRDKSVAEARYGLAWALRETGDPRGALTQIEALLGAKPEGELLVSSLEMAIWCAKDLGDARIAVASWQRFEPMCKDDARRFASARVVARSLQDAGEHELAAQVFAGLRQKVRDPGLVLDLLIEEAWVNLESKATDRAQPLVKQALSRSAADPRVQEAAFFTGEARYDEGDFPQAIPLYRAAAREENGELQDDALYKLGFALLSAGAHGEAAVAFEELVANLRQSELWGESLFLAGECRYRAGDRERCVANLSRFRKEVPRHAVRAKALFRLGIASGELEQPKLAADSLTELLKSFPEFENNVQAQLEQGRALVKLKQPRAARASFDAVLAASQGSTESAVLAARARIEIGRMLFDAGDHEEALSQFLKVSLLYGDGEEVREATLLAGVCLEKKGDRDLAIAQYRKLAKEAPESRQGRTAAQRLREMKAN